VAAQAQEIKAYNLEVIKTTDWIVDLGREGGDAGCNVVPIGNIRSLMPFLYCRSRFTLDFIRRPHQSILVRSIVAI